MSRIATLTMNPSLDIAISVEKLEPNRKLRTSRRHFEPGGGGINVARGIKRSGGDVLALFPCGGPNAQTLCNLLNTENVDYQSIPVEVALRQNFSVLVEQPCELYHFVMPGPSLNTNDAERCLEAIAGLQPAPDYLVASGSLPDGVGNNFYARLAEQMRGTETRIILDSSGAPLKEAVKHPLHLVKVNDREFAQLADCKLEQEKDLRNRQIRKLAAQINAERLVVTFGDEGALFTDCQSGEQIWTSPPQVDVVSPVGAGDSFAALLTCKLAAGASVEEALRYAVAAAAAAVTTPGTELFSPSVVEQMYKAVLQDSAALTADSTPQSSEAPN